MLIGINYCDYCGSAGSIEFGMCQVCLKDYSENEEGSSQGLKLVSPIPKQDPLNDDFTIEHRGEWMAEASSAWRDPGVTSGLQKEAHYFFRFASSDPVNSDC